MSSLITVPIPSQSILNGFCSNNKVSLRSVVKLGFAAVLHQYFDLPEFTCAVALLEDHDDHTRYPITRSQRVRYVPDLASTISIYAALGGRETDALSNDDMAPLLVYHTTTVTLNGGIFANKPQANLFFAKEASFSKLAAKNVGAFGLLSYSCMFR
jgi:hypothetical protein